MTNESKQQFTLRITQANPTQLVVILYEMTLCYLEDAKQTEDAEEIREALRKAKSCINELIDSLHLEYSPAPGLLQLYFYCIRRLAACEGSLSRGKGDSEGISDVERVLRPLQEAYARIQDQNPAGPVMSNSQSIYAGLTYGRNSLNEDTAGLSGNRGMLV